MGNFQSIQNKLVARPPAPPPPPPPTPAQQCALNKVQLNQIQHDLTTKQTQVDTCDPQAAQTRLTNAAMKENTDYVSQKSSKLNELIQSNRASTTTYTSVRDAVAPILDVGSEVSAETRRLEEQNRKYRLAQRKERRNFLDTDPVGGVGGVPGVRTRDDDVMFFYWIALGLALAAVLTYLLNVYSPAMELKQKIGTGVGIAAVIYGIVYWVITHYG